MVTAGERLLIGVGLRSIHRPQSASLQLPVLLTAIVESASSASQCDRHPVDLQLPQATSDGIAMFSMVSSLSRAFT